MEHIRTAFSGLRVTLAPAGPEPPVETICPTCQGAGWMRIVAPLGSPDFGRTVPCVCKQAERATQQALTRARASGLDPLARLTFATFDPRVPGIGPAYAAARQYAAGPAGWLVLWGHVGCGKTHLAAAVAHAALDLGLTVHFAVVPDLLDYLRAAFAPDAPVGLDARLEAIREADLLVLDDLGTEQSTPWAREKLYQIANHRYNLALPTVWTLNEAGVDLDPRLRSRLSDQALATHIHIGAGDYRVRPPQGGAER